MLHVKFDGIEDAMLTFSDVTFQKTTTWCLGSKLR